MNILQLMFVSTSGSGAVWAFSFAPLPWKAQVLKYRPGPFSIVYVAAITWVLDIQSNGKFKLYQYICQLILRFEIPNIKYNLIGFSVWTSRTFGFLQSLVVRKEGMCYCNQEIYETIVLPFKRWSSFVYADPHKNYIHNLQIPCTCSTAAC